MNNQKGFTVIELIFIVAILGVASIVFFVQKNNMEVAARDEQRKTAINAMYYGLEEVFYKNNNYYPRTLSMSTLPSIDPNLFTDPHGIALGQTTQTVGDATISVESDYRYEPYDCDDDKCKSYTLRTSLENEADFVKKSRH